MPNDKEISLEEVNEWINGNEKTLKKDYFTFLEFPSISSESRYKQDVLNCSKWVMHYLAQLNFKVESWSTSGHPVIFASHLDAGPDKPTLLIYNHYDVQPIDPIEEWKTDPFKPTMIDGEVYARGAQDNKGQCFYVIQALKLLWEKNGKFPINIKLCIEGEEETGSAGLSRVLVQKQQELRADFLAVVDTGIRKKDVPAITLGMRGIITFDVEIQAAKQDLHSGSHGGMAINSLHEMVRLLNQLHDKNGKVTIPGFYDEVKELTPLEKKQISIEFDEEEYAQEVGLALGGESKYTPYERAWLRPTLEINGIHGGYGGDGFKTVIPAKALAKISCRLVPDQDPTNLSGLVEKYLRDNVSKGATIRVKKHPGQGKAARSDIDSFIVKCFSKAFEEVFKKPCEYIFGGGSIPIVSELAEISQSEVILIGLGLSSDQIHAPNEHFGWDRIKMGIQLMTRAIQILGNSKSI